MPEPADDAAREAAHERAVEAAARELDGVHADVVIHAPWQNSWETPQWRGWQWREDEARTAVEAYLNTMKAAGYELRPVRAGAEDAGP